MNVSLNLQVNVIIIWQFVKFYLKTIIFQTIELEENVFTVYIYHHDLGFQVIELQYLSNIKGNISLTIKVILKCSIKLIL